MQILGAEVQDTAENWTTHVANRDFSGLSTWLSVRFVTSGDTTPSIDSGWYIDNVILTLDVVPNVIPEAGTLSLLGLGLAGLCLGRRYKAN
jgi:PEP-CTERM motif